MAEKELKELKTFAKENGYDEELKDIYLREVIERWRIRMRANFQPNIRLATNILLVIGTFVIALKIAPMRRYIKKKIYVLNI